MKNKTKHFLFFDEEVGDFLVGAEHLDEAKKIAKEYFLFPEYVDVLSDFEAECSGLDEY